MVSGKKLEASHRDIRKILRIPWKDDILVKQLESTHKNKS